MKKILFSGLIILAVMLLMPLAVLERPEQVSAWTGDYTEIPDAPLAASDSFRILDTTSGEVTEMPAEEYIFGVVAAEMPALYDTEALKAQAVAAYTFACYRRAENTGKSYDLTTDHTTDQSFTTEEAARESRREQQRYRKRRLHGCKRIRGHRKRQRGPHGQHHHAVAQKAEHGVAAEYVETHAAYRHYKVYDKEYPDVPAGEIFGQQPHFESVYAEPEHES